MEFENAKKGISRIYKGEIFSIIAGILGLVVLVVTFIMDKKGGVETILPLAFAIAGMGILMILFFIISSILSILGVVAASKDERNFKIALLLLILGIAVSMAGNFFGTSHLKQNHIFSGVLGAFQSLFELLTNLFIIKGIINLSEKVDSSETEDSAQSTLMMLIIAYIFAFILQVVSIVFEMKEVMAVASSLVIVSSVMSLIAYFMFLGTLNKARKMF